MKRADGKSFTKAHKANVYITEKQRRVEGTCLRSWKMKEEDSYDFI